jgi:hypothetical protein
LYVKKEEAESQKRSSGCGKEGERMMASELGLPLHSKILGLILCSPHNYELVHI